MTFLAPGYLLAAGLVSLAVVGLHFLSTREPRLESLPTARFIPEAPLRAFSLVVRPGDLALLLLRVILILLIGAALARPTWERARAPVARIVAVDVSRAVGSPAEVMDSARRYLPDAASVILFADSAREVASVGAVDSVASALESASRTRVFARPGSLSGALVATQRAAARLHDRADSLELVLISAFTAEQKDEATSAIRALLPGGMRLVPVAAAAVASAGPADPPRLVWADSGNALGWQRRSTPDTVGAFRAGDAVVVYPFVRNWEWTDAAPVSATHIFARWLDGTPAGVEWQDDDGCVRSLGLALPTEGDALLRPEFQRFLSALNAPCGAPSDFAPLGPGMMAGLAGSSGRVATDQLRRADAAVTPLMPWLLGMAILLALVELAARRRREGRA